MNVSQLDSDTDFLCGTTSASYSSTNKRRNHNIAYNDVARLIWESAGGWQFDDSNATTLPIAKTTLVHNVQDVSLPTNAMRVHEVAVKDSNGHWNKLKPIDWSDQVLATAEEARTPGLPLYYDQVGTSIMLYPSPSSAYVSLASGIAFYIERNVTELAVTATTTEPGFPVPFHRILSYAAALDFVRDDKERQFLAAQKQRLEQGLTRFYGKRAVEAKTQIKPAGKKRWRIYT